MDNKCEIKKHHREPPFNLKDQRFGKLTVVELSGKNKSGKYLWKCHCDCGNIQFAITSELRRKRVKSCGCIHAEAVSKALYKGCGDISRTYWNKLKEQAKRRGIVFNLEIEYAWKLFCEQDGKCSISGLPIVLNKGYASRKNNQTASLDRVDSDKGYVTGNVTWVYKTINFMKLDLPLSEFISFCKAVAANN